MKIHNLQKISNYLSKGNKKYIGQHHTTLINFVKPTLLYKMKVKYLDGNVGYELLTQGEGHLAYQRCEQ